MRFVFVDRIVAAEPLRRIDTLKNVSATEDVFADHFPGYPVFPGALVVQTHRDPLESIPSLASMSRTRKPSSSDVGPSRATRGLGPDVILSEVEGPARQQFASTCVRCVIHSVWLDRFCVVSDEPDRTSQPAIVIGLERSTI